MSKQAKQFLRVLLSSHLYTDRSSAVSAVPPCSGQRPYDLSTQMAPLAAGGCGANLL